MSMEKAPAVALLVIAVGTLIKAAWLLLGPDSFKRFVERWLKVVKQINTLTGIVCVLLAVVLWLIVLLEQPLVNWVLVILGGLFIYGASLYFRRESLEKAAQVMILDRGSRALRVWGVTAVALSGVFLWIAIRAL